MNLTVQMLKGSPTSRKRLIAREVCRHYFKDEYGAPFILTDGQADIFNIIFLKEYPRNQVIAPTQYGKSDTISMALLIRSCMMSEQWAIVSGSQDQAQIIMNHLIRHVFDHPVFYTQLETDPSMPLDRIKRERSKKYLNWRRGGEVRTYSADARNQKARTTALTGFGASNVIGDESSLIPDDLQVMIDRMLGKAPSWHPSGLQGFMLKIGNPFNRNHFLKTWRSDKYKKVFIDYVQAIREGRYTAEFVDEMRGKPWFEILYECKFPAEQAVDDKGWRILLTEGQIAAAMLDPKDAIPPVGAPRLGIDVAGGGTNQTVFVLRYDNVARILESNHDPDTMANAKKADNYAKEYDVPPQSISIDDNGVGNGASYRLIELGHEGLDMVKSGGTATENDRFVNQRSERLWNMGEWIKNGGKLIRHEGWYELGILRYKEDTNSRLKFEPKEELRKRGIPSPDYADSLSFTFGENNAVTADDFSIV